MAGRKIEILQTMHGQTMKWIVKERMEILYTANTPVEAMEWITDNVGLVITANMYI